MCIINYYILIAPILLGLCFVGLIWNWYFHKSRNDKTMNLYTNILDLAYRANRLDIYEKLPEYNKVVYSFKPIKAETWLSIEDIEILNKG